MHTKGSCPLNGTFDEQEKESAEQIGLSSKLESMNINVSANNKHDKVQNLSSDTEVSNKTIGHGSQLYQKKSNLLKAFKASEVSEGIKLDAEKVADNKIVGESNEEQPSSILDKLFGSVSTLNSGGSTSVVEVRILLSVAFYPCLCVPLFIVYFFLKYFNRYSNVILTLHLPYMITCA